MSEELKEVLDLTKLIYANNFTNEANYVYFDEAGNMRCSNVATTVGSDEFFLQHNFKTPVFKNVGIPAKELHQVLSNVAEFTLAQHADSIEISSEHTVVQIPTAEYEEPPLTLPKHLNWDSWDLE